MAAAQLAQRFVQRRLFLAYEALFVLGSVLAAASPGVSLFFAGRVLQGVGRPALPSPVTVVHARPGVHDETAEPLLPWRDRGP